MRLQFDSLKKDFLRGMGCGLLIFTFVNACMYTAMVRVCVTQTPS
jgi:hypothetical protein